MEEIKEIFKDKNFSDETLRYIENFIYEFDSLFGKYLPKKELIHMIKENLEHDIIWEEKISKGDEKEQGALGSYDSKKKTIRLSRKMDDEDRKTVFFHEMIHCITTKDKMTGFTKEYFSYDLENIRIYVAHGLTEGFTQYVTNIRDKKYRKAHSKVNSYPVLTMQTANLIEIIGQDIFFNIAFNNPNDLANIMDFNIFDEILSSLDIIWKNERILYQNMKNEDKLTRKIWRFGREDIIQEQMKLITNFAYILIDKGVNNLDDFVKIFKSIRKYSNQLDLDENYESYMPLLDKLYDFIDKGIKKEEILGKLSGEEEIKKVVKEKFLLDSFQSLDKDRRLEILANLDKYQRVYNLIFDSKFSKSYRKMIVNGLIEKDVEDNDEMCYLLIDGLANIILKNGYNIDRLAFENIIFEDEYITIFNLYNTDVNNKKYIGTYIYDIDGQIRKFTKDDKEKEEFEAKHIGDKKTLILSNSNGETLKYIKDGIYIFIDNEGNEFYSKQVIYQNSILESLKEKVKHYEEEMEKVPGMRYVLVSIIDKDKKRINDILGRKIVLKREDSKLDERD